MRGWIAAGLVLAAAAGALAQVRFGDFGRFGGRRRSFQPQANASEDGRFTVARLSSEVGTGGRWDRGETVCELSEDGRLAIGANGADGFGQKGEERSH